MYAQGTSLDRESASNTSTSVARIPQNTIYEVMALYPYCVLLRDTRNGVRTCPGYNTLSLMLRGSEVGE